MKKNILIVTEGLDKAFMQAFIVTRFPEYEQKNDVAFVQAGGRNLDMVKNQLQQYQPDNGSQTLVVFDAEESLVSTRQSLEAYKQNNTLEFDFFIMPNNTEEIGNFETLLRMIAPKENASFFKCWDNYKKCIGKIANIQRQLDQKTEIYAYCDAFLPEAEIKKSQMKHRDYADARLWDLQHPALQPLYAFFAKHL